MGRSPRMTWRADTSVPDAWAALAGELPARKLGDGTDLTQEHYDEVWELMGFLCDPDGTEWAEFRHRNHPRTGKREYIRAQIGLVSP